MWVNAATVPSCTVAPASRKSSAARPGGQNTCGSNRSRSRFAITNERLVGAPPGTLRTRAEDVNGVRVHYLATPVHFRWMGLTPTLPRVLERAPRPDVVHVFGFRDPVGTGVAAWCRLRRVPYVFEGMGMVAPKHRKVLVKRALDATAFRGV